MEKNNGFPHNLLKQSNKARLEYFRSYTMAHPHLSDAYDRLRGAIRESAPGSLIFVFGPAGAGKTTLRLRVEQKVSEEMLKELETDPGRLPIIGVEIIPPEFGNFNWKDFYKRLLMKLDEPCIDQKINPNRQQEPLNGNSFVRSGYNMVGAELRHATEKALHYRRPMTVLMDEAQHLAKMASGRKLQDQLDAIKSLANITQIPIVLVGTYELLIFRNLSAQLSRRSVDVHLRRYRAEKHGEAETFKNVLWGFQHHLPLVEQPDLVKEWDYFYERSTGCVGVLKDWLSAALTAALKDGGMKMTKKHLQKSALSVSQCEKMLTEAVEGEMILDETKEACSRLRRLLGLEEKLTKACEQSSQIISAKNTASKPRNKTRPGNRKPKRDPSGNGHED